MFTLDVASREHQSFVMNWFEENVPLVVDILLKHSISRTTLMNVQHSLALLMIQLKIVKICHFAKFNLCYTLRQIW